MTAASAAARPSRTALLVAYAMLYVVWGSTYLAIRIGVQSWTPFMLAATRFAIAGVGLYAVLRARGAPAPGRRAWLAATLAGGLMLCGGNGTVCWAEQWVPSGETALILSTGPLWMVLLPWLARRAPAPRPVVVGGIFVGLGGVAILIGGSRSGTGRRPRRPRPAPRPARAPRREPELVRGLAAVAAAAATALGGAVERDGDGGGEPHPARRRRPPRRLGRFHFSAVPGAGWAALAYLIVFGSLAGFGSYVFLLVHEGPARASTNAFVNPLIAVALGAALAGEPVGARTFLAAGMIVAAVAGVIRGTAKQ